jgi:hypothetical protein
MYCGDMTHYNGWENWQLEQLKRYPEECAASTLAAGRDATGAGTAPLSRRREAPTKQAVLSYSTHLAERLKPFFSVPG